jgi:hypothetical protein
MTLYMSHKQHERITATLLVPGQLCVTGAYEVVEPNVPAQAGDGEVIQPSLRLADHGR